MAHRLVVHPFVKIPLQDQELPQVVAAPAWPVVRCKQHLRLCTEHLQTFVDVLRPVQGIAHQGATNRHQVVHRVRAVFCHAERLELGEIKVHLGWCFGFRCQLEDHTYAIHHQLLSCSSDFLGWGQECGWADWHGGSETAIHMPARSWW